jgi:hypothetical protein
VLLASRVCWQALYASTSSWLICVSGLCP